MARVFNVDKDHFFTSLGLYFDAENPSKYIETFIPESWEEHLSQHERITAVADKDIKNSVRSFHIDKNLPIVSHLIAETL